MKNTGLSSRRFRYGSAAFLLTAVIVAAVLLLNAIFSLLSDRYLLYTDLTSQHLYTLSQAAIDSIASIDKDVDIIFCDDEDNIMENTLHGYVYQTARGLEKHNSHVHVSTVNIWRNPTAVQQYKTMSKSNIYSTSIIVASGTEFRVFALRAMYVFNDNSDTTPWSYNGEKRLCAAIMAVTRAESPICCVTYNHGEPFVTSADAAASGAMLTLLEDAGYKIRFINLTTEEIPDDCRLLVIYNPLDDFLVIDGVSDISEIQKIDKFLDGTNSLMVFMNPTSPVLPNLEEYLEEWGIKFDRHTNQLGITNGCYVKDTENSVSADGLKIVGAYTSNGLGASLHSDLRTTYPPKVVFPNVMGITYETAAGYNRVLHEDTEDATKNFTYFSYYSNGVSRDIYDVFNSFPSAVEISGGVTVRSASELEPFHLMTVTRESRMADNTTADYSYVIACGSTEFLSNALLQSNTYGNDDLMLSALRAVSKELVIVNLDHKPFAKTSIENITTAQANAYTWVLILLPAVITPAVAIYVLVRRKYRR